MIMLGVLAATFLVSVEAKRRGQNPEVLWDMLIWIVIAGIIGARIWHILTPSPSMIAEGITTQ
jgi:phosphatidylglycerol---prolipoprotein diacylglyceryl transferase